MTVEPDQQPNLGVLLFIPLRYMEQAVLDELKAHGHDVPINQARVFARIGPQGSRLVDLARAAQVSKQTIGTIVDQLQQAGYVERRPDPVDGRSRLVVITERGQHLIELTAPVVQRIEEAWEAHLGKHRTRQLREALTELRRITDPYA